jgi:hypothetical protein
MLLVIKGLHVRELKASLLMTWVGKEILHIQEPKWQKGNLRDALASYLKSWQLAG